MLVLMLAALVPTATMAPPAQQALPQQLQLLAAPSDAPNEFVIREEATGMTASSQLAAVSGAAMPAHAAMSAAVAMQEAKTVLAQAAAQEAVAAAQEAVAAAREVAAAAQEATAAQPPSTEAQPPSTDAPQLAAFSMATAPQAALITSTASFGSFAASDANATANLRAFASPEAKHRFIEHRLTLAIGGSVAIIVALAVVLLCIKERVCVLRGCLSCLDLCIECCDSVGSDCCIPGNATRQPPAYNAKAKGASAGKNGPNGLDGLGNGPKRPSAKAAGKAPMESSEPQPNGHGTNDYGTKPVKKGYSFWPFRGGEKSPGHAPGASAAAPSSSAALSAAARDYEIVDA